MLSLNFFYFPLKLFRLLNFFIKIVLCTNQVHRLILKKKVEEKEVIQGKNLELPWITTN